MKLTTDKYVNQQKSKVVPRSNGVKVPDGEIIDLMKIRFPSGRVISKGHILRSKGDTVE
ncbi:hypothetical protein [Flammeovirga pectinis]|uniref:hypothetical protein n=1 Tax=Flammeovirga pectinis TaxID=2494373 RepID=UPI0012D7A48C|nr:hypothetical protein [Flammeovirga pectinis]